MILATEWASPGRFCDGRGVAGDGNRAWNIPPRNNAGVPSGEITPLSALAALFQGHEKRSDPVRWALSPNASWLLVQVSSPSNTTYVASTLDGSRSLTRSSPGGSNQFMWMANGQGWFEVVEQRTNWVVRLHRLDSSEFKEVSVELPADSTRYWRKVVAANGSLLAFETHSGGTSRSVDLVQIDLSFDPARLVRDSVALPRPASVSALFVSPDGERLAWHLVFKHSRLSGPRFSRQFPFVDFEKVYNSGLWVSKIDGSQMREVGPVKPHRGISAAGWTPDGQHLGFVYLNLAEEPIQTLWTVSVE
ncbi:MAG: hypothetical protein ABI651_21540 [Verrucomicrobiota bacterium]